MVIAGVPEFKEDDRALVAWYAEELDRLGVDVRLNTKATKESVAALKPDAVLMAEGSTPVIPKIDGARCLCTWRKTAKR